MVRNNLELVIHWGGGTFPGIRTGDQRGEGGGTLGQNDNFFL